MKNRFLVGLLGLFVCEVVAETELALITEDYRPFQYVGKQGQLEGFGVELVEAMFLRAGVSIKDGSIQMLPWARGYNYTIHKANSALFMTVRNEARENLFKWVGPLAPRTMWLYKLRARRDIQLETLEDAHGYRIGGYNQSADTLYMESLGFQIDKTPHQHVLTRYLLRGRVDLISSLEMTMSERLKELGESKDVVEKVMMLDKRYSYYLALNKATPDEVVEKLQHALDGLKQDGTYAQLWAEYSE
ncbi:substrate-binding periplasmic protein [Thaumasiovibrio subtropicus]|uniref:substrate-binding periplasmic protein n=1 Tax=Thaumasiovibrio subtropicus TaxID=1891207 RepID=UPI00131BBEC5|nr:ABC transporter substrate-binding protein [Thaumasiovibrio subtropicus]